MPASSSCRKGWPALALGLSLAASGHAESRPQAELTCLLDSGELLTGSGSGPAPPPPWQGLASLRRGDESRARLTWSSDDVGFWPGVTTSAVLRLDAGLSERAGAGPTQPATAVRDVSSWIGVAWQLGRGARVQLRAFPFDTDYWRLGYLHALDWGGTDVKRGESSFLSQNGGVPGVSLSLTAARLRLFSGLKWARVDDALRGERRLWGVLSGGSFELLRTLRVDGGFGYFQRPALEPGASAGTSFLEGGSLRVVWHRGVGEPELSEEPFRPASFEAEPSQLQSEAALGFAVAFEGCLLVQRLRRFETPSTTTLVPAPAAALYGSARGRALAAHLALTWQSLAFSLRNDARLAQGQTFPSSSVGRAELRGWLGGSVTLGPLVPSLELGLRLPAALETPSAVPGLGQVLLVGGQAGLEALPAGAGRLPVLAARLGTRLQASAAVALSVYAEYQRDPNRLAASSPVGVTRRFAPPDRLSVFVAAQARF